MSKAKTAEKVCILWRNHPTQDTIYTLIYRPEGTVRTYAPNAIDGRVGEVEYVYSLQTVIDALKRGDGAKIAVPVFLARRIGDRSWVFAD